VIQRAVAVHVLHGAVIEARPLKTLARLDRLLDRVATSHVAQLHAHLRRSATHLDVLELDDLVELPVDLHRDPALDLSGRYHLLNASLSLGFRSRSSRVNRSS